MSALDLKKKFKDKANKKKEEEKELEERMEEERRKEKDKSKSKGKDNKDKEKKDKKSKKDKKKEVSSTLTSSWKSYSPSIISSATTNKHNNILDSLRSSFTFSRQKRSISLPSDSNNNNPPCPSPSISMNTSSILDAEVERVTGTINSPVSIMVLNNENNNSGNNGDLSEQKIRNNYELLEVYIRRAAEERKKQTEDRRYPCRLILYTFISPLVFTLRSERYAKTQRSIAFKPSTLGQATEEKFAHESMFILMHT